MAAEALAGPEDASAQPSPIETIPAAGVLLLRPEGRSRLRRERMVRVADGFGLEQEQRDDLQLIRWIGQPELEGWKRADLWAGSTPRFVGDYGMFHSAGLLYPALLGLVWRLTAGLTRWALPEFDGVSICERVERPYELVRWEYGIEWHQSDWPSRDRGFVVAESHRTLPSSDARQMPRSERFEGAALTPVPSWPDLISLIPFGDQANTLCLFAIGSTGDACRDLLAVLRADARPGLESVLANDDDMFAVLTQEDEGLGLSSLLIAGRGRLRNSFDAEVGQLAERVDAYLAQTAAARTLEEWSVAVDRLAEVSRGAV
jgi:hypothetical protein